MNWLFWMIFKNVESLSHPTIENKESVFTQNLVKYYFGVKSIFLWMTGWDSPPLFEFFLCFYKKKFNLFLKISTSYGNYWFRMQKKSFIANFHVLELFIPKKTSKEQKKFRLSRGVALPDCRVKY
jgi:hypothetical protein